MGPRSFYCCLFLHFLDCCSCCKFNQRQFFNYHLPLSGTTNHLISLFLSFSLSLYLPLSLSLLCSPGSVLGGILSSVFLPALLLASPIPTAPVPVHPFCLAGSAGSLREAYLHCNRMQAVEGLLASLAPLQDLEASFLTWTLNLNLTLTPNSNPNPRCSRCARPPAPRTRATAAWRPRQGLTPVASRCVFPSPPLVFLT